MSTIPYIAPPADGLPMPRRLWAILAVAFGVGLSLLESAIDNDAQPTIGLRYEPFWITGPLLIRKD